MNCDTITKQLSLLLYGELSFEEEEIVHTHLDACPACRNEYSKVKAMFSRLNETELEPPQQLLQDCRRNLRLAVAALPAPGAQEAWWKRWMPTIAEPPAALKAGGAVALIAIGFFSARLVPNASQRLGLMGASDPVVSRVRYVQPEDQGRVQIVLEEVRQRVLSGDVDDQRIRGYLLTAARESSDPGVRVGTMDLLKGQSETAEVRRALLFALQHDANPGVRLKAIDALRTAAQEDETRRVLTEVLLSDTNPGVRTKAIDLLTQKREPALVGVLQELMAREDNSYVRMKCQKALTEMNASVEMF